MKNSKLRNIVTLVRVVLDVFDNTLTCSTVAVHAVGVRAWIVAGSIRAQRRDNWCVPVIGSIPKGIDL